MQLQANRTKASVVTACVLGVVLTAFAVPEDQPQRATPKPRGEKWIWSSSPIDHSFYPALDLSEALQKNPRIQRFHLSWFYSMGSFSCEGVAIYDRSQGKIWQRILQGDWESRGIDQATYRGVSDDMLHRFARDWKDKGNGPFNFDELKNYGATVGK